jgi:hypothetical protein
MFVYSEEREKGELRTDIFKESSILAMNLRHKSMPAYRLDLSTASQYSPVSPGFSRLKYLVSCGWQSSEFSTAGACP